jgi:hypothetical protein
MGGADVRRAASRHTCRANRFCHEGCVPPQVLEQPVLCCRNCLAFAGRSSLFRKSHCCWRRWLSHPAAGVHSFMSIVRLRAEPARSGSFHTGIPVRTRLIHVRLLRKAVLRECQDCADSVALCSNGGEVQTADHMVRVRLTAAADGRRGMDYQDVRSCRPACR